jgi:hypothetical protein
VPTTMSAAYASPNATYSPSSFNDTQGSIAGWSARSVTTSRLARAGNIRKSIVRPSPHANRTRRLRCEGQMW